MACLVFQYFIKWSTPLNFTTASFLRQAYLRELFRRSQMVEGNAVKRILK